MIPALADLLDAYYQLWEEDYPTAESVLDEWVSGSSPGAIAQLDTDIVGVLSSRDEFGLRNLIAVTHSNVSPVRLGLTDRQWLEHVREVACGAMRVARRRAADTERSSEHGGIPFSKDNDVPDEFH
ncbi:contact-dependent growth inhibition system immunity protein [Curtobacterium sp. Leaf261]|uniref:contact-dependent growth inhibition system immunity protein n=1 Tax=Curtobacterium sp. Leaf261 TaxID=1736311 RepID=UPI00138F8411